MNQTFHTLFQLHKSAIFLQGGNTPRNLGPHRIFFFYPGPWIRGQLFDAQRYAFLFPIKTQHFYRDLITDLVKFRRMPGLTPSNVGHVDKAVNTTEIDKQTIIGNVGDRPINHGTFLQVLKHFFT